MADPAGDGHCRHVIADGAQAPDDLGERLRPLCLVLDVGGQLAGAGNRPPGAGLVDEVASLRHSRYIDGGVTEQFAQAAEHLYRMFRSGVMEDFTNATHRLPTIRYGLALGSAD
jgi:hypothetical protein